MDINQQPTAIDSYNIFKEGSHNIDRAILLYLEKAGEGVSDRQLMDFFGRPRNVISGARNRLYKDGKVIKLDTRTIDPNSGRWVSLWQFKQWEADPVFNPSAKELLTIVKRIVSEQMEYERKVNMITHDSTIFNASRSAFFSQIRDLVFPSQTPVINMKPPKKSHGTTAE